MTMTRSSRIDTASAPTGSTLTEVLVSIMIMAIGVVSVATMFPLSMMRSVQANQLTSSTILRYNAQAFLEVTPLIVFDPDDDWVGAQSLQLDPKITKHYGVNYLVDPLGYYTLSSSLKDWVGNDGAPTPAPVKVLQRFPGFDITLTKYPDQDGDDTPNKPEDGLFMARGRVTLPDSWKVLLEAPVSTSTPIAGDRKSLTLASTADLSEIKKMIDADPSGKRLNKVRAIIFDANTRQSQSRDLVSVDDGTKVIAWNDKLPDRIVSPRSVRIDVQESKYTWLLNVRRQKFGNADIDIVIFDKRSFAAQDEQVLTRTPSAPVFKKNSLTAYVQFDAKKRPQLRKGSYLLNVNSAHWYRIQGVREKDAGGGKIEAELQLSQPAAEDGNQAIFMRGVVDVYPIGTKSI